MVGQTSLHLSQEWAWEKGVKIGKAVLLKLFGLFGGV